MKKVRVYNDYEIKKLLSNPNVERIKNKSQIVYKNSFKMWAIKEKLTHEEKTAREIFVAGGFDMNILDSKTPQRRLYSWLKKYKMFGENYFNNSNKYSYKAIEKNKNANSRKLIYYVTKILKDPNGSILIVYKNDKGELSIKNYVSGEYEEINN